MGEEHARARGSECGTLPTAAWSSLVAQRSKLIVTRVVVVWVAVCATAVWYGRVRRTCGRCVGLSLCRFSWTGAVVVALALCGGGRWRHRKCV